MKTKIYLAIGAIFIAPIFLYGQTNIAIGNTTLQSGVKAAGINMGQEDTYGSFQILKNLIAYTPGFQDSNYESVLNCTTGSTSSGCVIYSNYFPSGFWTSGNSIKVLTGSAAGCTTTVSSFSGSLLGFSSSCAISVNDYIVVTKPLNPTTTGSNYLPANGWSPQTSSGGSITASSSAPPAANGSTYARSVQMTTSTGSDYAYLTYTFDNQYVAPTATTKSFIDLNGNYTFSYWAKAATAGQQVFVKLARGSTNYITATDTLTTSWAQYTHTVSLTETGDQSSVGSLTYGFATVGAETINVSKCYFGESTGDPNGFRSSVVSLLQNAHVGSIRFWDGETLTGPISNFLVDQWAQQPTGSLTSISGEGSGVGYNRGVTYSYPSALGLCQSVGNTECWLVLPVTMTTAEATYLIDYLAGGSGTAGGAFRISQGYSSTWTSVLPKIHLEFGNEAWNGAFAGGSMEQNYPAYGALADTVFAAMKADSNYDSAHISLVLDGQSADPGLTQSAQASASHNDEIDVGPYTNNNISDSTFSDVWSATLAEPQVFWQSGASSGSAQVCAEYTGGVLCPSEGYFQSSGSGAAAQYGGQMYLNSLLAGYGYAGSSKILSIYEQNFSTTGTSGAGSSGGFTQAQMNQFFSSGGAGLATAEQILTNLAGGVKTQNLFQLPQYYYSLPTAMSAGATYFYGWGSVVDIGGPTNLQRPQLVAESAINAVIPFGGTMLQTTQTGTPTFTVGNTSTGATINTVATASANTVLSYAFSNGSGNYSLVMLNLDQTSTHAVTFSGANAPTGTVAVSTVNSPNLTDNNETSANYTATTSSLTNPTGMTLPAHSLVTLSYSTSGGSSTITPTAPQVSVGGTVTLNSTGGSSSWTLSGVGSISSTSGTSTVYTPPASIPSAQNLGGCPVLPPDSVFYTPITNLPTNSLSSNWTAIITGSLSFIPSWGTTIATNSTPTVSITPFYGDNISSQPTYTGVPFPGRTLINNESGAYISNNVSGLDRHTVTVQKDLCKTYEYYDEQIPLTAPEFSLTEACHFYGTNCNAASMAPGYSSNQLATFTATTDAANLLLAPLTLTLLDMKQSGGPKHALRFTQASELGSIWPAYPYGTGSSANIPYGARFRLKTQAQGGPNTATVCGSNQLCLNVLSGLQTYGMILADIGSGNQVETNSDVTEDPNARAALSLIQAANITGTSYVAIDESSLQETTGNHYQMPSSTGSYAVDPSNSYAVPSTYAKVCATTYNVCVSIGLQGYGVGLQSNSMQIAQGSAAYQIPYWITPNTATQTAVASIASETCSGDYVTSGGSYTPPTTGAPCTTTIKLAATNDSTAVNYLYISVIPLSVCSGQPSAYRIDFNNTTGSTDVYGCSWSYDNGVQVSGANFAITSDYPSWVAPRQGPVVQEYTQYQSAIYTYGGDIKYCIVVPNGNYKVRWLQGLAWNGSSYPQGSVPQSGAGGIINSWWYGPNHVVVNGTIESHYHDWIAASGYQWATPSDVYVPARITNNQLCTGTYKISPDQGSLPSIGIAPLYYPNMTPGSSTFCNGTCNYLGSEAEGLEIIPDSTSPYWSIDTQGATTITSGQNIQLFNIDWYTGVNDPTWTIFRDDTGAASVSSSGMLTLASGAYKNNQVIQVKASDGTYSAIATFYVSGQTVSLSSNPIDPSVTQSFSSFTAGMTQIQNWTFGTASGRNVQNATQLANSFSRYGIAGSTVIDQTWQVFQPFTTAANYVFGANSLTLTGTATALSAGNIQSGQITSNQTFGPPGTPGNPTIYAFEVNATLPYGQGAWAVPIWLFKPTNTTLSGVQELNAPEVDFEEYIQTGYTSFDITAYDHVTQTDLPRYASAGILQGNVSGNFYTVLNGCGGACYVPGFDFSLANHLFQVIITPDAVFKYVDGVCIKASGFKWTSPSGIQILSTLNIGTSNTTGFPGLQPTSLADFPAKYQMSIEHISVWSK